MGDHFDKEERKLDVFTAISQRSSVRAYKDIDVEEDKLRKILETARLSPSASNRQEWKFVVVKNKETRKDLAQAAFGLFWRESVECPCCIRVETGIKIQEVQRTRGLNPTWKDLYPSRKEG